MVDLCALDSTLAVSISTSAPLQLSSGWLFYAVGTYGERESTDLDVQPPTDSLTYCS